ncbi:MAG: hypothetical protein R3B13_26225 [Polyangiaceae bacterium]
MGIISVVLAALSLPLYMCCGLLALAANVIGLILAFVSHSRIKQEPDRFQGSGLAIAGLAVNGAFLVLNIVLMVFVFGLMGIGMLTSGSP